MEYIETINHTGSGDIEINLSGGENKIFRLEFYDCIRTSGSTTTDNWNFWINDITTQASYINNGVGGGSKPKPNASLKDNYAFNSTGQMHHFTLVVFQRNHWVMNSLWYGILQRDRRGYAIDLGTGNNLSKVTLALGAVEELESRAFVQVFGGDIIPS